MDEPIDLKGVIHNIFINFFGEDKVDLQDNFILVHFPEVTVTNEFDESVDITHLYVRIKISDDGTMVGGFQMLRSEYTEAQISCGYCHSHVTPVSIDSASEWRTPCIGSGPIQNTLVILQKEYSDYIWQLFCLELSNFVKTESIFGVPYVKLTSIDSSAKNCKKLPPFIPFNTLLNPLDPIVDDFILYVVDKRPFKFNFCVNYYGIALSVDSLAITLSNLFIEFYNTLSNDEKPSIQEMFEKNIINYGKIVDSQLAYITNSYNKYFYNPKIFNQALFTFKGKKVFLSIVKDNRNKVLSTIILLSINVISYIVNKILRTVNNRYGQSDYQPHTVNRVHRYL